MATEAGAIECPTCGQKRAPAEFYSTTSECRLCKKERSQQHRATAALKIALADRLVAVLEQLAAQGWQPELIKNETTPGGAGTPAGGLDLSPSQKGLETHA